MSNCANVRYRKMQVFLWFTINSLSKLKKSVHCFWAIYQERTWYSRFHDGLFELKILEIFTTAFLLKTFIWNWIFSSPAECAPLKRNKKSSKKRRKSPKNCLTVDITRDKSKKFKKEKEKQKMRKSQTKAFLLLLFYIHISLENISGKT